MTDTEYITKIATRSGYRETWQEYVNEGLTQREAYRRIEMEYREIFNESRYKTFKSFYMSRYRDIKNKLSQNNGCN